GARNAELPRSFDSLCDSVSSLLERRLVSSPNVGVLERSHLKHLNEEKSLIGEATAARVLAATVLIDLQFEKAGRSVRVKALLSDANGRAMGNVSVDERELDAKTIQTLADRVLAALHAAPVRVTEAATDEALSAQRSRESDRFFREARLMQSFRHPDRALRAAESAVLLEPRPDRRAILARLLFEEAVREVGPAYATVYPPNQFAPTENIFEQPPAPIANDLLRRALSIGGRALDIVLEFKPVIGDESEDGLFGERTLQQVENSLTSYVTLMLRCVPASPEGLLVEQARSQYQAALRRQLDLLDVWHEAASRDPNRLNVYSSVVWSRCFPYSSNPLCELLLGNRAEFERLATAEFERWWKVARKTDGELPTWSRSIIQHLGQRRWPEAESRDAIRPTLEAMVREDRPLAQVYAKLALLQLDRPLVAQYTVEHLAAFQVFRRDIESTLGDPRYARDIEARSACYGAIQAGLESMSAGRPFVEQADEWLDVCHDMLDRREVFPRLFGAALQYRLRFVQLDERSFLAELNRAIAMTQPGSEVRLLSPTSLGSSHAQLERSREVLLTKRPELFREAASRDVEVRTLLDLIRDFPSEPKIHRVALVCRWAVDGDQLYAAVLKCARGNAKLEAIRLTLPDGVLSVLGEADLGYLNGGTESPKLLPAVCLTDDAFVVAHRTQGLFAFDRRDSGVVSRLAAHAEFPSKSIESLAQLDGRLYAGLEGGYLVEFKQHEAACRVIASSRRKEKQSGLDDRAIYTINRLAVDVPRRRLLFATSVPLGSSGERSPYELWEYRPESGMSRRLITIVTRNPNGQMGALYNDHLLWKGSGWMIDFDAGHDSAFGLTTYKVPYAEPMPLTVRTSVAPQWPAVRMADAYWSLQSTGTGPGNIRFNGAATFSRLRFDTQPPRNEVTTHDVPPADSSAPRAASTPRLQEELVRIAVDPLPPYANGEGWLLEAAGDGRLLWSDHRRLWLLTPKKPANDESPAPTDRR
ncbi:MAG: hypothetical protein H7062_12370, partial [Candidatus Saccharimonas sp.]|nr:hypothetical protein [Planctomycetaceae bacterium]